ncbi:MAG: hypothetical protein V1724_02605 [Chloroflexota bacterium]
MRKTASVTKVGVGLLLLFLPLSFSGCCGGVKYVTIVLDNRLARPVLAVYSVQYTDGDTQKWAIRDQQRLVDPGASATLFTYKKVEAAGDEYLIKTGSEDGEVICEWTFTHSKIVYHEYHEGGATG